MERVQRRVLHMFAQSALIHLSGQLEESLPTPERNDRFHPAKKYLGHEYDLDLSNHAIRHVYWTQLSF